MHIKQKCKHGCVVQQCRCPGGTWVIVPCPSRCSQKDKQQNKPYDWAQETDANKPCTACNGKGYTSRSVLHSTNANFDGWAQDFCAKCKGTGYL